MRALTGSSPGTSVTGDVAVDAAGADVTLVPGAGAAVPGGGGAVGGADVQVVAVRDDPDRGRPAQGLVVADGGEV